MFSVFGLNITYPGNDGDSAGDANEKADPAPEGSRACSVMLNCFAFSNPFRGRCVNDDRVRTSS